MQGLMPHLVPNGHTDYIVAMTAMSRALKGFYRAFRILQMFMT